MTRQNKKLLDTAPIPDHLTARLWQKSLLSDVTSKSGIYGFGWQKADEYGRAIKPNPPGVIGANWERQDEKCYRVMKLKKHYQDIWGNRSAAKKISDESDMVIGFKISVRSVQRYMKDHP